MSKNDIRVDNSNNRIETAQARIVLGKMLSYLNLKLPEICTTSNGKPFFKDSNIFFNYSHSKNYVACAISNYELGIDIEEIDRNISDNVAKKYLNNEKDNLKRIETWVKKEAYSKLKGLGFQIKFQSIKLSEVIEKNLFISDKDYMCSIYCDNNDVVFEKLAFNRNELLR